MQQARKRQFLLLPLLYLKTTIPRFSHDCLPDGSCDMCSKRNTLILLPASGCVGEIKSTFKRRVNSRDKGKFSRSFFVKLSYLIKPITPYSLKLLPISKSMADTVLDTPKFISLPKHTDRCYFPASLAIKCVIRLSSSQ